MRATTVWRTHAASQLFRMCASVDSDGEASRGTRWYSSVVALGMAAVTLVLLLLLASRQRSAHHDPRTSPMVLPVVPAHGESRTPELSQLQGTTERVHLHRPGTTTSSGALRYQTEGAPSPAGRHSISRTKQHRRQERDVFDREVSRTVREAQADPSSMFDMSTP